MKRFRFALDVVLRLRQRREQTATAAYVRSRAACDAVAAELTRLRVAIARQDRWARTALSDENYPVVDMEFYRQLTDSMRRQFIDQSGRLRQAQAQVQADREALLDAMRHREALDRLRVRRQAAHGATQRRLEAAELDDLYVSSCTAGSRRQRLMTVLRAGMTPELGRVCGGQEVTR